jgi:hypothetical protein
MKSILYFFIIISILVIFYIINYNLKNIENYDNLPYISKTTIILTSTVNINEKKSFLYQKDKNERIKTYLKSILQWLNKTDFNIVLVENSGYTFDELYKEKEKYRERFEVISFKENEIDDAKYLMYNNSKGASEIFAINYAFNHSNLIKNYDTNFIIKITARYFIPELESYLKKYDLDNYDCLTQNNRNRCEMVGSHIDNFSDIFNPELLNEYNNYDGHIENIWKYRTSLYDKVLVCKEFNIDSTQRGGLNKIFITI